MVLDIVCLQLTFLPNAGPSWSRLVWETRGVVGTLVLGCEPGKRFGDGPATARGTVGRISCRESGGNHLVVDLWTIVDEHRRALR